MLSKTEKQNSDSFKIVNMLVEVVNEKAAPSPPFSLLSVNDDPEFQFTEETAQYSHSTLSSEEKKKSSIKEFHL